MRDTVRDFHSVSFTMTLNYPLSHGSPFITYPLSHVYPLSYPFFPTFTLMIQNVFGLGVMFFGELKKGTFLGIQMFDG